MSQDTVFDSHTFLVRLSTVIAKYARSAREVSLALGKDGTYLSGILRGNGRLPTEVFHELLDYLKISPLDFYNLEDEDPRATTQLRDSLKGKLGKNYIEKIEKIDLEDDDLVLKNQIMYELKRLFGKDVSDIPQILSRFKPSDIEAMKEIIEKLKK